MTGGIPSFSERLSMENEEDSADSADPDNPRPCTRLNRAPLKTQLFLGQVWAKLGIASPEINPISTQLIQGDNNGKDF